MVNLKELKSNIKEGKKTVITVDRYQFEMEIPSIVDVIPMNIKEDNDAESNLKVAKSIVLKKMLSHNLRVCDVDVSDNSEEIIPFSQKDVDSLDIVNMFFDDNPHVLNDVCNQLFSKFEERSNKLYNTKKN